MTSALALAFHGLRNGRTLNRPENLAAERYTVSTDLFREMANKIRVGASCTVKEFLKKSKGDWLILTFDDGLLSDFETAYPILSGIGIRATFFVTVENIGCPGYTDVSHLREMSRAGMEIGSHGLTHRYLTKMAPSKAAREISESKDRLEQKIGTEVTSFAAVGGHTHRWMLRVIQDSGYHAFACMVPGRTRPQKNLVVLRRNHIQAQHDLQYVSRLVAGNDKVLFLNYLKYRFLQFPKLLLGMDKYDLLKRKIFEILK